MIVWETGVSGAICAADIGPGECLVVTSEDPISGPRFYTAGRHLWDKHQYRGFMLVDRVASVEEAQRIAERIPAPSSKASDLIFDSPDEFFAWLASQRFN